MMKATPIYYGEKGNNRSKKFEWLLPLDFLGAFSRCVFAYIYSLAHLGQSFLYLSSSSNYFHSSFPGI